MNEDHTITEETACSENRLSLKRSIQRFLNDPTLKVALLSTVIMTVLAHGFLFANEFFSHDSLSNMSYSLHSLEYYTMIGRFLIPFYEQLKGYDLTAPWVVGILFVVWMSASSYLAARFFVVSKKWSIALISGLLCTNIALSLTGATYIYCLDEYAFSLFAAIAAAYCFCRLKRWKYLGILFVILSLGFYQAYVTVTVCLCFVDVMHRLIKDEESSAAIFARGIRHVALIVAGVVLYYIVWQAMCNILNVQLSRVTETILSAELSQIPLLVSNTLLSYWQYFTNAEGVLGKLFPLVNLLLIAVLYIRIFSCLFSKGTRSMGNKLLLICCGILLPFVFNARFVLFLGRNMLTAFSMQLIYILCVPDMEGFPPAPVLKRYGKAAVSLLLCCVLWHNILFANEAYIKKELEQTATLSVVTRIIDRIEQVDGYVPNQTPVCTIGFLHENTLLWQQRGSEWTNHYTGLAPESAVTAYLDRYVKQYLGYPMNFNNGLSAALADTEAVKSMPVFPAPDSIQMIDGTVVVRVS